MSEEDLENLTYHIRCRLLNCNSVLVAFPSISSTGQKFSSKKLLLMVHRRKPSIMLFVQNFKFVGLFVGGQCSSFCFKHKEEYIALIDQIDHAFLPDRNENQELHNLVKLYQLRRHSKHAENIKMQLVGLNLESFSQKNTSC